MAEDQRDYEALEKPSLAWVRKAFRGRFPQNIPARTRKHPQMTSISRPPALNDTKLSRRHSASHKNLRIEIAQVEDVTNNASPPHTMEKALREEMEKWKLRAHPEPRQRRKKFLRLRRNTFQSRNNKRWKFVKREPESTHLRKCTQSDTSRDQTRSRLLLMLLFSVCVPNESTTMTELNGEGEVRSDKCESRPPLSEPPRFLRATRSDFKLSVECMNYDHGAKSFSLNEN